MKDWGMKDWIMELCPEIADWQAEMIAEAAHNQVLDEREACAKLFEVEDELSLWESNEIMAEIRARGE